VKNAVTLFHTPSSPASSSILSRLKEATAVGASNPAPIQLDVTEGSPTNDQLKSILDYAGEANMGKIVEGARDIPEAQRMVRMDAKALKRPIVGFPGQLHCVFSDCLLQVVDWNAGKVVFGDDEAGLSAILSSEKPKS
jgi:hypothetical protein